AEVVGRVDHPEARLKARSQGLKALLDPAVEGDRASEGRIEVPHLAAGEEDAPSAGALLPHRDALLRVRDKHDAGLRNRSVAAEMPDVLFAEVRPVPDGHRQSLPSSASRPRTAPAPTNSTAAMRVW